MCEFISWIELDKDGEKHLLYLTDQAVYDDPHGRDKLKGCKDNDFLGHGAIRAYYGLKDNEGEEFEQRDFWETKSLPKELADKVAQFDKYWGRMFSDGVFQKDDLCYIATNAQYKAIRLKAFEQLLKQEPSNNDLRYLAIYAKDKAVRFKAYEQLLKQKLSSGDLGWVVAYAKDKAVRFKAYEQFLKRGPSNNGLLYLALHARDKVVRLKAFKQLLKQGPSNYDLRYLATCAKDKAVGLKAIILRAKKLLESHK